MTDGTRAVRRHVASTTDRGRHGEDRALAYLLSQGLQLIERNARGQRGEIDLVMRDGPTLVFVEVRLRRSAAFGGAAASIGADKQARMWRAAEFYLQRHARKHQAPACRFDAVCIEGDSLHWLRHVLVR